MPAELAIYFSNSKVFIDRMATTLKFKLSTLTYLVDHYQDQTAEITQLRKHVEYQDNMIAQIRPALSQSTYWQSEVEKLKKENDTLRNQLQHSPLDNQHRVPDQVQERMGPPPQSAHDTSPLKSRHTEPDLRQGIYSEENGSNSLSSVSTPSLHSSLVHSRTVDRRPPTPLSHVRTGTPAIGSSGEKRSQTSLLDRSPRSAYASPRAPLQYVGQGSEPINRSSVASPYFKKTTVRDANEPHAPVPVYAVPHRDSLKHSPGKLSTSSATLAPFKAVAPSSSRSSSTVPFTDTIPQIGKNLQKFTPTEKPMTIPRPATSSSQYSPLGTSMPSTISSYRGLSGIPPLVGNDSRYYSRARGVQSAEVEELLRLAAPEKYSVPPKRAGPTISVHAGGVKRPAYKR
ncbi:hypothetical protein V1525DRAFT_403930 [Lipomyces kononenkoae]|uniref:Uncharacterized protein n=1 Tax=Lipomyces kononenkoae TaxID=34357 RepID=A0ACC3T0H4_LIPKO